MKIDNNIFNESICVESCLKLIKEQNPRFEAFAADDSNQPYLRYIGGDGSCFRPYEITNQKAKKLGLQIHFEGFLDGNHFLRENASLTLRKNKEKYNSTWDDDKYDDDNHRANR